MILNEEIKTLEEYKNALNKHDWFYFMSDDPRVYESGSFNHNKLVRLAGLNKEYEKQYNKIKELKYKN